LFRNDCSIIYSYFFNHFLNFNAGKSFALIIGIDNYEKYTSLEFAVNDAEAVAERLKETGFDNITVILDKEAT
jgi:uncharacterized caspase-like protein